MPACLRTASIVAAASVFAILITGVPAGAHQAEQVPALAALPGADVAVETASSRPLGQFAVGQVQLNEQTPAERAWVPGNETATRPWSAPVGHHQPRVIDVPTAPASLQRMLEEEDARIDRIVKSICRGC